MKGTVMIPTKDHLKWAANVICTAAHSSRGWASDGPQVFEVNTDTKRIFLLFGPGHNIPELEAIFKQFGYYFGDRRSWVVN